MSNKPGRPPKEKEVEMVSLEDVGITIAKAEPVHHYDVVIYLDDYGNSHRVTREQAEKLSGYAFDHMHTDSIAFFKKIG